MFNLWANEKGGVGKSTLAVHAAVWLSDTGFKTALLDADKQFSSSKWIGPSFPQITIRRSHSPRECDLIARELIKSHDFVVADTPGGTGKITRTLLLLADLVVFPIGPSILDLWSVSDAIKVLREAQEIKNGRPEGRLVLNKVDGRTNVSEELLEAAPKLGLDVASSVISLCVKYAEAPQQATVVSRLGYKGREAAAEMDSLFNELFGTEIHNLSLRKSQKVENG